MLACALAVALRVAFVVDDGLVRSPAEAKEIEAAWQWLARQEGIAAERIGLSQISRPFDVLWWHETALAPQPLPPAVREALLASVRAGRGLLLSLRAVKRLVELGLEDTLPNGDFEGAREWEPDAMFGFESYGGHPLLDPFFGGVYTWRPSNNEPYWRSDYVGDLWPKGRVIAVEKAHIALEPRRRVMWEHRVGSGRILAVSSFLYFSKPSHRFRAHLERFSTGALRYLEEGSSTPETFWSPRGTGFLLEERSLLTPPLVAPGALSSLGDIVLTARGQGAQSSDPWDLSGLKLLACGTRSGRLNEVWAFPVRIARELEWGVKLSGQDEIVWLSKPDGFHVTPHAVQWEFRLGPGVLLRPRTWVDREKPAVLTRFDVASEAPLSLYARFRPELTSEWPRLEGDLGMTRLVKDPESGFLGWESEGGDRAALLAMSSKARSFMGETELFSGGALSPPAVGGSREPIRDGGGAPSQARERAPTTNSGGVDASGSRGEIRVPLAVSEIAWRPGDPDPLFALVGGAMGLPEAARTAADLLRTADASYDRAQSHSKEMLSTAALVTSEDASWNQSFRWAVAMLDRFVIESPGVGRGLMAGFEASRPGWFRARPGYAWYFGRDALWCAFALDALGRFKDVEAALDLLKKYQEFTGKILHELTPTGSVHYDAADSTPLYLIALAHHLRWSGNVDFIRSHREAARKALAFLRSTDTDGDGLIENTEVGHGWIEGGKLYGGHTTFYLAGLWAEALGAAGEIESALGNDAEGTRLHAERERVRAVLERDFWNAREGAYYYSKLEDGRFREAPTILPAVPMGFGTLDPSRGAAYLDALASSEITSDWGARILARSHPAYDPVGYHEGSVWPLFSGWAALAEYAYHRPRSGYLHIAQTLATFRDFNLGAIEEVFHGDLYRPRGITSHQAWSESLPLQATLEGMLGARPDALRRSLSLAPHFPPSWREARAGPFSVGDGSLRLSLTDDTFRVESRGIARLVLAPAFPEGSRVRGVTRDGRPIDFRLLESGDDVHVEVSLPLDSDVTEIAFDVERAPTLEIPLPALVRDQPSRGLRHIRERARPGRLEVDLEGREGLEYEVTVWDAPPGARFEGATPVATQGRQGRKTRALVRIPGNGERYRRVLVVIGSS